MRRQKETPASATELTCRPARAEWLCCFLGPSTPEVLPPELLPPEDFPFPPAIVVAMRCTRMRGASGAGKWREKEYW